MSPRSVEEDMEREKKDRIGRKLSFNPSVRFGGSLVFERLEN